MTRIYLIRHAEAEGNLYRRVHGWYDSFITDDGMRQIAQLEARFRDIPVDAVFSSDLRRARVTAQAVAGPKGLEIQPEPGLRELGMGIYEDLPFGEFAFSHPEAHRRFLSCSPHWAPPGGETFRQVAERMTAAFFRLAGEHPDKTLALFSHSTAIRCFQASLRGKHPSQMPELRMCENTGVSCYEVTGDRFRILFENDASHLPPELGTIARRKRAEEKGPIPLVRFRSMDMETEAKLYYTARQDAWMELHGSLLGFDGPGFLREARECWEWDGRAVQWAVLEDRPVGLLQLATLEGVHEGVGYVPFLYVEPSLRRRRIGSQLLGQAVSTYRSMGRRSLRLQCSPENEAASRFYHHCGFQRAGQVPGACGALDLLEKPI